MDRQERLSLLFLLLFIFAGTISLYLLPERDERDQQWAQQNAHAVPPGAGKTSQHHKIEPARAFDNTAEKDKKTPKASWGQNEQAFHEPDIAGRKKASDWLTPEEKEAATGTVWELTPASFRTAFSQHREELLECFTAWKEKGTGPPTSFQMHLQIETLFGVPHAAIQSVNIPEVSTEKGSMEGCIHRALSGVLFQPPPGDRVTVNIPMNFAQVQPQAMLP